MSTNQQVEVELRARNEVSFYQSVECTIAAKNNGLITDDNWFLDWCARLNLGNEAARAGIEKRLPDYGLKSTDNRCHAFTFALAGSLPKKTSSTDWIRWHVPLLALSTTITTTTSFGDEASAAAVCLEILSEFGLIDPERDVTATTLNSWAEIWLKFGSSG